MHVREEKMIMPNEKPIKGYAVVTPNWYELNGNKIAKSKASATLQKSPCKEKWWLEVLCLFIVIIYWEQLPSWLNITNKILLFVSFSSFSSLFSSLLLDYLTRFLEGSNLFCYILCPELFVHFFSNAIAIMIIVLFIIQTLISIRFFVYSCYNFECSIHLPPKGKECNH